MKKLLLFSKGKRTGVSCPCVLVKIIMLTIKFVFSHVGLPRVIRISSLTSKRAIGEDL